MNNHIGLHVKFSSESEYVYHWCGFSKKKEKKREQETRKVYTDNFLICCVAIHFFI